MIFVSSVKKNEATPTSELVTNPVEKYFTSRWGRTVWYRSERPSSALVVKDPIHSEHKVSKTTSIFPRLLVGAGA